CRSLQVRVLLVEDKDRRTDQEDKQAEGEGDHQRRQQRDVCLALRSRRQEALKLRLVGPVLRQEINRTANQSAKDGVAFLETPGEIEEPELVVGISDLPHRRHPAID